MAFFCEKLTQFLSTTRYNSIVFEILSIYNTRPESGGRYIDVEYISDIVGVKYKDFETVTVQTRYGEKTKLINIKIGRFLNKIVSVDSKRDFNIDSKMMEFSVNLYKNYFDSHPSKLKVVEGDDILKYYNESSYFIDGFGHKLGTLWKSCMRYDYKNSFMEIFARNPEVVKLLVFLSDDGKLKGRALLWKAQNQSGECVWVMDRIYTIYDHHLNTFKEWAVSNRFIYKYEQSNKCRTLFVDGGITKDLNLKVQLSNVNFEYYPYMDTFTYFNKSGKFLINYEGDYRYHLQFNYGGLTEGTDNDNRIFLTGEDSEDQVELVTEEWMGDSINSEEF